MNRLSYLSLIHLSTIPASNADYAIEELWKPILRDSGIYEKYKHLCPSSLIHKDWLDVLSKRYDSKMWLYYKEWIKVVILAEVEESKLPKFYLIQHKNNIIPRRL